jgi:hypothetical protein
MLAHIIIYSKKYIEKGVTYQSIIEFNGDVISVDQSILSIYSDNIWDMALPKFERFEIGMELTKIDNNADCNNEPLFYIDNSIRVNCKMIICNIIGKIPEIQNELSEMLFTAFGFNPNKISFDGIPVYVLFRKDLISISRSRIIKDDTGKESLFIRLNIPEYYQELKPYENNIRIETSLLSRAGPASVFF